ncbi:MAG: hypothetical protein ACKVP3_27470 [Hyphomicrobiaceae bacterium]
MQRWFATDIRARATPALPEAHEKLLCYAAWLDIRAKSAHGGPEDRARAAEATQWLKHWLQQLCSPSTTAFIVACAEREVAALADVLESPIHNPQA